MFRLLLPLKPFVFLDHPALRASTLLLGLADEVADLGRDAIALGRAHAHRVLGDFLGRLLHLLAQLAGTCLGLGIEVGDAGHLAKLLLRLPEARDGIALPCFRLPSLALFLRLPRLTFRPLRRPRRLFLVPALGLR